MQTPETRDSDLNELHALYIQLSRSAIAEERRTLTEQILFHPKFQVRLRSACGAVLRRWAGRSDLCGDVMQEATLMIVEQFREAPPACENLGLSCFGRWCYTLCFRACLKAWGKSRPLWFRSIRLVELETLSNTPDRTHSLQAWDTLVVCLNEISDDMLRGVLVDWAVGVPTTDTASRYSLSSDSVWRLRQRGLAHLRKSQLEQN